MLWRRPGWGACCRPNSALREQVGSCLPQVLWSAFQTGDRVFLRRVCSSHARFLGASRSLLKPSPSPHTSRPQGEEKTPCALRPPSHGEKGGRKGGCRRGRNSLYIAIRKAKEKPPSWDTRMKQGQDFEKTLGYSSSADSISRLPDSLISCYQLLQSNWLHELNSCVLPECVAPCVLNTYA